MLNKYTKGFSIITYFSLEQIIQRLKNSGQKKPWWNNNYQKAVTNIWQLQKYQEINILIGIIDINLSIKLEKAQNQLQKIVKRAKQKYYKKMLKKLDHKNIFWVIK